MVRSTPLQTLLHRMRGPRSRARVTSMRLCDIPPHITGDEFDEAASRVIARGNVRSPLEVRDMSEVDGLLLQYCNAIRAELDLPPLDKLHDIS